MKSLRKIFHEPPVGSAFKWPHYFEVYERHFEALRSKPIKFLEIGVFGGGSLWMWKTYFENSQIVGLDINPDVKQYEGENVSICIGDQADAAFLDEVGKEYGPFDIVLDDGGHRWDQQIISLETLFPYVKEGGLYVIEDLHNSYPESLYKKVRRYFRSHPPAIEYLKGIVDAMHFRRGARRDPLFSGDVAGVSFYEGIAVIAKGRVDVQPPIRSKQYFDEESAAWVDCEVDEAGHFIREE